jgi:hypothetical protein
MTNFIKPRHLANCVLVAGCAATGAASAEPACATSVRELRALAGDPAFALRWQETSMGDGKPLVLTIAAREGALVLEFVKTREGLWADGPAAICPGPEGLQARFAAGSLRIGPAAHWIVRHSMAAGATFTLRRLPSGELKVATNGWSGIFAALP